MKTILLPDTRNGKCSDYLLEFTIKDHEYTDEELLLIYRTALTYNLIWGLCACIDTAQLNLIELGKIPDKFVDTHKSSKELTFGLLSFKEIAIHMPEHPGVYWWDKLSPEEGEEKRKEVLLDAIEVVKKRIKNSKK